MPPSGSSNNSRSKKTPSPLLGPMPSLAQFRKRIIRESLFPPCQLAEAIQRLGFVQADPIRCPARAQDLILRHRVKNYRAGDLEQHYPTLDLEESFLYAYGFLSPRLWQIIHPKTNKALTPQQKNVLQWVRKQGSMHPKELESLIGKESARNCWGGISRTGKLILDSLHHRGDLRVARREKGIRIYEFAEKSPSQLSKEERFQEILLAALQSMGPTTKKFLLSETAHFGYLVATPKERPHCLQDLIDSGRVQTDLVDSVEYLSLLNQNQSQRSLNSVRILSPFDPIVRDRTRFEHLWGWSYRFEAYTPKAKRKLGYYAMPVLWKDDVIGWANATVEDHKLHVHFGYVSQKPYEPAYQSAAESEVAHMAKFLGLTEDSWEASSS